MDGLEFCVKSLSYPLGMGLEGLKRRKAKEVKVGKGVLDLPELPFPALCYLTTVALFDALDMVDKKRLQDDYAAVERFRKKLLNSRAGEGLRPYLESPGRYVSPGERVSIDWLEFERRREAIVRELERIVELWKSRSRGDFLEETAFLSEVTTDQGLLILYLAGEEKLREPVSTALGRHNREFSLHFKALRG